MTIHNGDCVVVMRGMPADSVDAVVTDPPYGLEFMGKGWDKFGRNTGNGYQEKPRMNEGKGLGGYQTRPNFYTAGTPFQAWCTEWGTEALRVTKPGGYLLAFGGTRTHHRLVCGLEDAGWIIRDELDWIYASGFPKGKANLKPAHEPIVLARKPGPLQALNIEETRIGWESPEQALERAAYGEKYKGRKYGPEGDWPKIQGTQSPQGRWPSNVLLSDPELFDQPNPWVVGSGATTTVPGTYKRNVRPDHFDDVGEWGMKVPEMVNAYGDSGGYSRFFIIPKAAKVDREPVLGFLPESRRMTTGKPVTSHGRNDGGNPESSRPTRTNTHATVKPTDLMRHLVRLVTPPGGTVLDPFLGSGTTAIACELEGFPWIGIEKEPEYVAIAEARLNGTQRGLGLDVPAPTRKQPKPAPGYYPDPLDRKSAKGWSGRWKGDPTDEEPAA